MPAIDTEQLLWLCFLLLLTNMVTAYIALSQRKGKFKAAFGIYWDEQKQPRCPAESCRAPLKLMGSRALACSVCHYDHWIELRKDSGERITLEKAKELL